MRFSVAAVTLFTLATSALSAVIPPTVEKYNGETNGKYIVQLREGADKAKLLEQVKASKGEVTYDYSVINGFAGVFPEDTLKMILDSPLVESVTEDGLMTASGIQTNAPWGLARISDKLGGRTDPSALDYQYYFPQDTLGAGTDIYVVDTGVRTSHVTFGGRARWGATFGPYADADGNGHGTHCAGTAAGTQYGVAKKANIIAVKVLSDEGSGYVSDIIAGLGYVLFSSSVSRRPSIVNLSLGGGASPPLDNAVRVLASYGVHVAVAAGNDNKDAGNTSPARERSVVTVGASTITDERAYFSNYGSVVDIFAPGYKIISAWIDNDTATKSISGTSMATPHVAGLIAYLISVDGNISTASMSAKLQALAKKNVLSSIPSGTFNLLAQNH